MNLLEDHIRSSGSTEEGVKAYVLDVTARYPQLDPYTWGHRQQATCHWTVGYVTRADMAASLLMMPFWLIGHVTARESKIEFVTFHYLTYSEARRLGRMRVLKHLLLPFVIFAVVAVGIALVMGLFSLVVTAFNLVPSAEPLSIRAIDLGVLCVLGVALLFLAALKAQRRLWKMGQPPHTDAFCDQRIQLKSVKIQATP
jgi:hypothetical protein